MSLADIATFAPFLRLPPELRHQIWTLALPESIAPAAVPYKLDWWRKSRPQDHDSTTEHDSDLLARVPLDLSLFSACREARSVTLTWLQKYKGIEIKDDKISISFDASRDVLYISTTDFEACYNDYWGFPWTSPRKVQGPVKLVERLAFHTEMLCDYAYAAFLGGILSRERWTRYQGLRLFLRAWKGKSDAQGARDLPFAAVYKFRVSIIGLKHYLFRQKRFKAFQRNVVGRWHETWFKEVKDIYMIVRPNDEPQLGIHNNILRERWEFDEWTAMHGLCQPGNYNPLIIAEEMAEVIQRTLTGRRRIMLHPVIMRNRFWSGKPNSLIPTWDGVTRCPSRTTIQYPVRY